MCGARSIKIEKKNHFWGKVVISRIIILLNVFWLTIAHFKLKFTLFSTFTLFRKIYKIYLPALFSILLYNEEFLVLHTISFIYI